MAGVGLGRTISIYDYKNEKADEVRSRPGSWAKASKWVGFGALDDEPEAVRGVLESYAWAWYALEAAGKLEAYGLGEQLTVHELYDMMDKVDVVIGDPVFVPLAK